MTQPNNQPSFIVRFLVVFVPLVVFMFLIFLSGIRNTFMMIILALAFTWMVQALYKKYLDKKQSQSENNNKK
ncbi:MAG: hypothetical protein KBS66_06810 [Eubacterium sp.]|nr:hypothetical protein [Candidatus Colimonas fimequi]